MQSIPAFFFVIIFGISSNFYSKFQTLALISCICTKMLSRKILLATTRSSFKYNNASSSANFCNQPHQVKADRPTSSESPTSNTTESKDEDYWKRDPPNMKWYKYGMYFLGTSALGSCGYCFWRFGSPEQDADGTVITDEFSSMSFPISYTRRLMKNASKLRSYVQEPSSDKLLPDVLKPPYIQPKYTLVVEMKDVLLKPEWTYEGGWRFKKRPGLDFFIKTCGYPNFELVIFTHDSAGTAIPLVDSMDPENHHITYKLFRDATFFKDGCHKKDLSYLNRDLSKVIFVDVDSEALSTHPRNLLKLPKYDGSDVDVGLVVLTRLLQTISETNVEDVRPVLEYYSKFDDPLQVFQDNVGKVNEQAQKAAIAKAQNTRSFLGPKKF